MRISSWRIASAAAALLDLLEDEVDEDAAEQAADDAGEGLAAQGEADRVEQEERDADDDAAAGAEAVAVGVRLGLVGVGLGVYSHSIVPGGLLVMSSTTRLTSRISLIMREAICSSRS